MTEGIGILRQPRGGFNYVALCHGKIQDKDFYAFVAIAPRDFPRFKATYHEGAGHFDDYGRELLRGWGEKPPPEVFDYLQMMNGVEFTPGAVPTSVIEQDFSPLPLKPLTPQHASARLLTG